MPFAPKAPIDLALKERIRVAYYEEEMPIGEVEAVAGVGRSTLYRWFHAWGWPLRKPMRSRAVGPGPVFGTGGPGTARAAAPVAAVARDTDREAAGWQPAPRASLKQRLRRLVEHRIALLEHEAMAGVAVDIDANARAIDLNARTLVTIEQLGGEPEPCPHCSGGPPTRSLSELRDELYGHLARIQGEERVRRAERRKQRGLPPEPEEEEDLNVGKVDAEEKESACSPQSTNT
ncbi:hypothetical protein [uncultured Enterovirga sp.]|uniref:hypothetical protein n=1 Tax=uncultured Enterovirga sp. TaxID=2026352 RepID=UPI0035C9F130